MLYRGSIDCLVSTVKADGILSLWRGLFPVWLRMVRVAAASFSLCAFLSPCFPFSSLPVVLSQSLLHTSSSPVTLFLSFFFFFFPFYFPTGCVCRCRGLWYSGSLTKRLGILQVSSRFEIHTHTHTLSLSLSLSLSHRQTHTHSLSHTHTLSLSHAHTYTSLSQISLSEWVCLTEIGRCTNSTKVMGSMKNTQANQNQKREGKGSAKYERK